MERGGSVSLGRFCLFAAPQETWEKGQLVRSAELNIFRPPHSYSRQAEQKYSSRYVQTVVSTGRVHAPAGLLVGPRTIREQNTHAVLRPKAGDCCETLSHRIRLYQRLAAESLTCSGDAWTAGSGTMV